MLMLLLTGGEPLLRQDFDEIYVACKKMGLLVTVNTNATLIDEAKIELFKQYPPYQVNVTLYGASPETYGKLCGNAAAFQKATCAIRRMVDEGIKVKLNYSITPSNVADIPAVTAFAKELNLQIQAASYMFAPVRGGCGEHRLTAEEAARAKFEWKRLFLGDGEFLKTLESDSPPVQSDVACSEPINCRAGCSTFWVTWQGEMSLCGMMAKPSIPITDFSDAWRLICAERDKIYLPAKCNGCEYRKDCDMCAAVAVAETDKSDCVPDYACKKAHEYAKLISNLKQRQ
jgi:MoaA/NifB/PqqE/SkfB family radical SAM enzyme